MFKCFFTNRMSKSGEKPHRVVIETRPQIYFGWFRNEETERWEQKEIGRGFEIVKEVMASDEGLRLWKEASSSK